MSSLNERPGDKLWRQLTHEQVKQFHAILTARDIQLEDLAYKTLSELAKYLFAANTGAAAGLFLLLKSSTWNRWELISFFTFCIGTFFVGVSYIALASWSRDLSDGYTQDFHAWGKNEITVSGMDANERIRLNSWKKSLVRIGLVMSFALLFAGGVMAGIPFCTATKAQNSPRATADRPIALAQTTRRASRLFAGLELQESQDRSERGTKDVALTRDFALFVTP